MATANPPSRPKTLVLCFDGTGNKFSGTEADSNVLKIFRMLDSSQGDQFHYYQPGIGTYVSSATFSNTGFYARVKSAMVKAKDSAVGSSFADHVMAGYRFLMRYYAPGDNMYFFGFSRGAYIARFLAEMIDYVGLLTAGNEELVRFAWKNYAKWQQRDGKGDEYHDEKLKMYNYMKAFRETFSRPVNPVRFIGIFDTVNSVPRFESAWMQRSKFPYTAKTSARVIRHAVGIDERRAKFRQDLISQMRGIHSKHGHHHIPHISHHGRKSIFSKWDLRKLIRGKRKSDIPNVVINSPEANEKSTNGTGDNGVTNGKPSTLSAEKARKLPSGARFRPPSPAPESRLAVPNLSVPGAQQGDDAISIVESCHSEISMPVPGLENGNEEQDIQEVWFPGGHADIGGGWELAKGELWQLSHAPLVWMVHEAQAAGLRFSPRALKQFECDESYSGEITPVERSSFQFDDYEELQKKCVLEAGLLEEASDVEAVRNSSRKVTASESFQAALHLSSTQGQIHDCLSYNMGVPKLSVTLWSMMEYLPFRRMDLQVDGSWKPIRWPLPRGEVRDIPDDAQIHVSAIRRLQARDDYRPGNLILGGGGRGVKRLPKDHHIGDWEVHSNEGCPIRETYVRRKVPKDGSEQNGNKCNGNKGHNKH
ncbi:hypothetical protein H109_03548 [Trichophyton interdigitale MR816]|uniref:T6SS Phospholipase effector Tle1-like catalytic domain-containing protein n=1 Tax=Trichophyton interdigitale (strain MR816) TaxID=1215338 RepID=A0A059J9U9_TRIIM|nr:hypothetical protein H101_07737 [Trichophyton interdigitale H6]KDB24579.1 hypothetical protein H109_03548 [Trichophyton interdigitale MR816]